MSNKKVIDLYLIRNLSNLHAGKGDSNYGIVDNEIQRDPVQDLPVIFSSSLKGSLREALTTLLGKGNQDVLNIFGNEVKNSGTLQAGNYVFYEARLLSLPVRSDNEPYFNATTIGILKDFTETLMLLRPDVKELVEILKTIDNSNVDVGKPQTEREVSVDEFTSVVMSKENKSILTELVSKKLLDYPFSLFSNEDFKSVCERLPVIARNQLEKGVSKNLFYEEVVPRQARFTFFVERPEKDDTLYTHMKSLNMRVQLGANATIGYGVCQFERISLT